jgi:DNA invertase Pin-like site-specific DNA recombinase
MLIGYARTSTLDQEAGLEAQERDLSNLGCDKVFSEQVSSVAPRAQLETALEYLRDGDTLVVTKLDRLARSVVHLGHVVETIKAKGAHLRIIAMGIDTSDATGTLMMNVLGAVAQFEREMMLERQREGIAKAKAEGKYRGRKPTAPEKADEVRKLHHDGVGATAIAKQVGIGRATVYRLLETTGT